LVTADRPSISAKSPALVARHRANPARIASWTARLTVPGVLDPVSAYALGGRLSTLISGLLATWTKGALVWPLSKGEDSRGVLP
jgi:hypothetical protein